MRIFLTFPYDCDPHSGRFLKVSHSEEEEDLLAGIAEIHVDTLRSKVHETEIDPGICDTVHDLSFIATRLVLQVRITDAKFLDATIITNIEEDVFEGWLPICTLSQDLYIQRETFRYQPI